MLCFNLLPSFLLTVNCDYLFNKVAGDWIWTRVLWNRKRPRCQLCHNCCQKRFNLFMTSLNRLKFWQHVSGTNWVTIFFNTGCFVGLKKLRAAFGKVHYFQIKLNFKWCNFDTWERNIKQEYGFSIIAHFTYFSNLLLIYVFLPNVWIPFEAPSWRCQHFKWWTMMINYKANFWSLFTMFGFFSRHHLEGVNILNGELWWQTVWQYFLTFLALFFPWPLLWYFNR